MSNVTSLATKAKSKNATNVRVGKNVRYIMGEREVNQVQLALALGLTESQVSRRITGSVDWTPEDLEQTARLLRVSIGDLFTLKLPGLDSNQEPIGTKLEPSIAIVTDISTRPRQVRAATASAGIVTELKSVGR